ncbi:MAG TPA: ABC transporter permease [Clostridia bacterium]|nr:ABC transporter permease [Clostridia bacterium]
MKKFREVLSAVTHDRQFLTGLIGVGILLIIVIFAPLITKYPADFYGPDSVVPPGSPGHFLGTNHMGQDIWSMLVYGTRTSLWVAVIAALISGGIGLMVGGIAGFFGGKIDVVISEIINIFMMIPDLFLIMLVVALFGNSLTNVMVIIGLTTWPRNAKLMRAQTLSLKERVFVAGARAMGENERQILFKYIIPNGMYPVISNTTMSMAYAVLTEASLSFLGLGDPNVTSWGQMIEVGRNYITTAPWVSVYAGFAVVFTVLVFNLLGDGLNHILNPQKIQRGER